MRKLFWAAADGSSLGQPLRDGTVPGSIATRSAFAPKISIDGGLIAFLSTANYSFDSTGNDVKIFTTLRQ